MLLAIDDLNDEQKDSLFCLAGLNSRDIEKLKNELVYFKNNRNALAHVGSKLIQNFDSATLGRNMEVVGITKADCVFQPARQN